MVGHFKRSPNKNSHILVAVDKFTKWVEAEPVSKCDAETTLNFLKKIIYRFGYPHSIIADNGTKLSEGVMQCSVRGSTPDLILHQSLTLSPIDKPRELTKSCFEASSPDSVFLWKGYQAVGRRNYPQYYGAYGRLLTGQSATRLSSWSMEQRPLSQLTYVTTLLEL